jgi:hypothetical protein
MNRIITGVLLVAWACVPALAQADVPSPSQVEVVESPGGSLANPAQPDDSPGSSLDYAAREAAAPQLAGFAGGGGGVYIGTGALAVALLVVLIILVVR